VLTENIANGAINFSNYVTTCIIAYPMDPAILFISYEAPRKYGRSLRSGQLARAFGN